jgi:hypothetical protein
MAINVYCIPSRVRFTAIGLSCLELSKTREAMLSLVRFRNPNKEAIIFSSNDLRRCASFPALHWHLYASR